VKPEQAYLQHILDEVDFLLSGTANVSFEQFIRDPTLTRACARSLEIIGEASKNVPDGFKRLHPEVDWRRLAGMRDKIIHHYFGVNWEIVWDAIKSKLPELRAQVTPLLDETSK
jgi:uncharacterized protein with HEPN domain